MKSWIKNIIKWYKDRDCKYFVIKIEDLAKALTQSLCNFNIYWINTIIIESLY